MADDPIINADRDQVINYAKDWHFLTSNINYDPDIIHPDKEIQEARDIHRACVSLAYNRTKEALIAYTKHRETLFAKHDTMLDTIEELLQEKVKDIKDVVGKE